MHSKITAKIFPLLLREIEAQLGMIHLKRDAFIDHLVSCELSHLEADLGGRRLSARARRHISASLKRLGTSQINISLQPTTAERLNSIVSASNIVRDAFINRVLYFALCSSALRDYLRVPESLPTVGNHGVRTSYLEAICGFQLDPLAQIRDAVLQAQHLGIYQTDLPDTLTGFSCYLEIPQNSSRTNVNVPLVAAQHFQNLKDFEAAVFSRKGSER